MIPRRLRLYLNPTRPYSTTSQQLITQWRRLLAGEDISEIQSLKGRLTTALQTRKERVQDVIPADILSALTCHYRSLKDDSQKRDFFLSLAQNFSIDPSAIDAAIENWRQRKVDLSDGKAADKLSRAAQPLYSKFWQPLVQETFGLEFLVDMRADLLNCIAKHPAGALPLRSMSEDIRRVLANWFTVGLLRLERVTWEGSSAAMLEMIAAEEKVHAIRDWRSLKHRLGDNRRVYVWTHTALPGKPLVALHIALCQHIVSSMDEILTDFEKSQNQKDPKTAMFYSISSMKQGLAGVDLGNNLIKRAVRELLIEHPTLQTFATISPMPGFATWLDLRLDLELSSHANSNGSMPLVRKREYDALLHALTPTLDNPAAYVEYTKYNQARLLQRAVHHISLSQSRKYRQDTILSSVSLLDSALQGPLTRLGAWYLAKEKRRGRALDPVANFHLRNGACIARINYKADMSDAGVQRSHGLMVNYEYDMALVEERNRKYIVDGLIDVSRSIQDLLID
jgi:malonyl-CoA decarboxylase